MRKTTDRGTALSRSGIGTGSTSLVSIVLALLALAVAGPAAAQQAGRTHVVKKGDTLWDLAARYLSNPFQWPAIFQLNRALINDPHWIYPGQEFRIPPAGQDHTRVAQRPMGAGQAPERPATPSRAPTAATGPQPNAAQPQERSEAFSGPSIFDRSPDVTIHVSTLSMEKVTPPDLVSPSDYYRASFVAPPASVAPRAITSRIIVENPLDLELPPSVRPYDRIVISLGGLSVQEGELLQAIRPDVMRGKAGWQYASMGLVRVTSVQGDSARAVVQTVFGDYQVGDPLIPAGSYVSPGAALEPVQDGMVAHLLGFETEQPLLSTEDVVFLDRGAADGVHTGDEFTIFSRHENQPSSAPASSGLSVVRVIRTMEHTASARVVATRDVGSAPDAPARLISRPVPSGG